MKRIIFSTLLCVLIARPAFADMGGSTIYFNFPGKMYTWDSVNGKLPVGDLWYWNDVLYGTLKADDILTGNEARFILASINPYAEVGPLATALASLDAWSDGTKTISGITVPKYVPGIHPISQQFQAMVNYGSYVGLVRTNVYLFYWDGTTSSAKLDGQNIIWTGIDVGCTNIVGATTVPVPVPGAVLLGMLGLGSAGIKLRKFA